MLKIITLVVVVFAVILLHGVYGGVHRRNLVGGDHDGNDVTSKRPKLIRVPLKRYDPLRDGSQTLDVAPVSRPKRQAPAVGIDLFDGLKRGPLDLTSGPKSGFWENSRNDVSDDSAPSEEFFRSDVKGFEGREQEERLAEVEVDDDVVDDQVLEMTEGRVPTDDEKERFDVESTTPKSMKAQPLRV